MNVASLLGYKNPANAAMPYLQQIPGTITPYYDPYINAGKNALNTVQGQYGSLIDNPGAKISSIGAGYQQSPGYQWQVDQGMNAVNQAAAAGGMAGSPQAQQQAATMVTGLANQDYYNYLNQVLGLYNTGLSGMGNLNQMGYGASNELAQSLANNLSSEAGLAYAGQSNENQANLGTWGAAAGLAGSMATAKLMPAPQIYPNQQNYYYGS